MSPFPPIDRRRFLHLVGSSVLVAGCSSDSAPGTACLAIGPDDPAVDLAEAARVGTGSGGHALPTRELCSGQADPGSPRGRDLGI